MADSHNLMVVLAHLQGVAATFRVGRHHHRGPLHEGRGLTHALTHTAPTDLTVAAALVRKAYSKRRRSCLWSKPVNLRTWRLVSDPIAMVQALAELRYGVVVHTRENSVKYMGSISTKPRNQNAHRSQPVASKDGSPQCHNSLARALLYLVTSLSTLTASQPMIAPAARPPNT